MSLFVDSSIDSSANSLVGASSPVKRHSALAASFRSREIGNSLVSRSRKADMADLALPASFEEIAPAAKIRSISQAKPDAQELNRFLNTGSQLNTLRQVQDSLTSVAAGIQ